MEQLSSVWATISISDQQMNLVGYELQANLWRWVLMSCEPLAKGCCWYKKVQEVNGQVEERSAGTFLADKSPQAQGIL